MQIERPSKDGSSENLDMAMEEITQGISRLKVPKSISFGRAPRGLHSGRGSRYLAKKHGKDISDHPMEEVGDQTNHSNRTDHVGEDSAIPNRRNRIRKIAREHKRAANEVEMAESTEN